MTLTYTIPLDPRTKKNHQMIAGSGAHCPYCGKPKKQFIRQGSAHTAYITKVHITPESDTYFPNLDEMEDWYVAETLLQGEEDGIGYEMLLYKKK